jgi:hypothetical protein
MVNRVLSLVIACALSGCASQPTGQVLAGTLLQTFFPNIDLPDDCKGHSNVPSSASHCMTRAEYDTERKKVKHSRDKATAEKDKVAESKYEEMVP